MRYTSARMTLTHKLFCALVLLATPVLAAEEVEDDFAWAELTAPEHGYWTKALQDPFTKLLPDLQASRLGLDESSERAFVDSLLKKLNVPASSQLLVFSNTSLQLRLISPRNPRALYFNDELYIGWVPGGQIEIVSIDPELGGIFYIFNIPRPSAPMVIERADRCMNCHASQSTGKVPGVVIKSVIPAVSGGSLDAFRGSMTGHGIPFADRFGGWHVTGTHQISKHWGNITGTMAQGKITTRDNKPGENYDPADYPVPTSDILPHLLHEHQAGFVNRAVEATYRTRSYLAEGKGKLSMAHDKLLKQQAMAFVRYMLFADEPPFPGSGIEGTPEYKEAFLANRKAVNGKSLKDLDLKSHLFRYRCSYMIYSSAFQGMPKEFKQLVYIALRHALNPQQSNPDYAYMSREEKIAIHEIVKGTIKDLPPGW